MSATAHPTVSPAAAGPLAGPQKTPVRRLNRFPLLIAVGMVGAITVAGITVAIDRANRRTPESP